MNPVSKTNQNFGISAPDFYLFSTESKRLSDTYRECYKRKRLYGGHSDGYLLCDIDPLLIGQPYGLGAADINQLVIATKHKGNTLFPINQWPMPIYVMRPLIDNIESKDTITETDVALIAWAELYHTKP